MDVTASLIEWGAWTMYFPGAVLQGPHPNRAAATVRSQSAPSVLELRPPVPGAPSSRSALEGGASVPSGRCWKCRRERTANLGLGC